MLKISIKSFFIPVFAGCLLTVSCVKEEAPNAECDIEKIHLHVDHPEEVFFHIDDSLIMVDAADSVIHFHVRPTADLSALAPVIETTAGARVSPASGTVHDFSQGPISYTVVSEDGMWKRNYLVDVIPAMSSKGDTIRFDFEHTRLNAKSQYYTWYEISENGSEQNCWASGNPGFQISMKNATPEEYPTVSIPNGFDGAAVQLTTRSTGPFGESSNKPIAAGNLYLGRFNVATAMLNPLKSTLFGIDFDKKPLKVTGYYKYTPGTTFQNRARQVEEGKVDSAAIYSVFYRKTDAAGKSVSPCGDDVQTNPNIVAMAKMKKIPATDVWTPFEITFEYYEEVDETKLAEQGYLFTLVFSSSYLGDLFEGAIGSQLMIDKVCVICEKK